MFPGARSVFKRQHYLLLACPHVCIALCVTSTSAKPYRRSLNEIQWVGAMFWHVFSAAHDVILRVSLPQQRRVSE